MPDHPQGGGKPKEHVEKQDAKLDPQLLISAVH
jgi:hypothetical protein